MDALTFASLLIREICRSKTRKDLFEDRERMNALNDLMNSPPEMSSEAWAWSRKVNRASFELGKRTGEAQAFTEIIRMIGHLRTGAGG